MTAVKPVHRVLSAAGAAMLACGILIWHEWLLILMKLQVLSKQDKHFVD